jgi:putative endonuclease
MTPVRQTRLHPKPRPAGKRKPRLPAIDLSAVPAGWVIYMLLCSDSTLYTGITNNLPKRLAAHDAGKGARYTRSRGPVRCVYCEAAASKGEALKREHAIKKLSRVEKMGLASPF